MKTKAFAVAVLVLAATVVVGQKKVEKPKLHADFYPGTYPAFRDAATTLAKDNAKLLMVGFHQGWSIEKIAKESKVAPEELDKLYADLEEARLVTEVDEYTKRPLLPVIRDKDIEKIQKNLRTDTDDFSKLIQARWGEIESYRRVVDGRKKRA